MEELIKNILYDVIVQTCQEDTKVLTWRGKVNEVDTDEWKIISECIEPDEIYLIKIKKRN